MSTFYTSDHHFGHHNMLTFQAHTRPYPNVRVMGDHFTELWNERVGDSDTVHHLGDFCLGSLADVIGYFSELNGHIKVTPGNHDRWLKGYVSQGITILSASGHPVEIMPLYHTIKIDGQPVVLCHFPMRSWPASFHGSWHLHGHVHSPIAPWGRSMNVGVDLNEGCLFTTEDVKMEIGSHVARFDKLGGSQAESRDAVKE